jgi:hypothetical protein
MFSFCYNLIGRRLLFGSSAYSFQFYMNDIPLRFVNNYSSLIVFLLVISFLDDYSCV